MARVSEELVRDWEGAPQQTVQLIVRVSGDLAERRAQVHALGGQVTHDLALTHELTVTCRAETALLLARQPWVERIVPDAPVQALGREPHG